MTWHDAWDQRTPESIYLEREEWARQCAALDAAACDPRLQVLVELRARGASLREVGGALGVSRERARQLLAGVQQRALQSLRGAAR